MLFIYCFLLVGSAYARTPRVKTVTAEYDYLLSPKESLDEGKLRAIEQAKLNAIADEFGTAMSQTNYTNISNLNVGEHSSFNSYSSSDVNGEWLETIKEETDLITKDGHAFWRIRLKGKIRELVFNPINLDCVLMANGTDPKKNRVRDDTFVAGDYLYVHFQSPVSGYLAVYLADCDNEQPVQCLIPYRGTDEGAMRIEADKPYVFFSREHADATIKNKVGRIKLNTNNSVEYDRLYILFSPNQFVKVTDKESDNPDDVIYDRLGNAIHRLPRQTDFNSFQQWLTKTRLKDPDMQNITTIIKIEKTL